MVRKQIILYSDNTEVCCFFPFSRQALSHTPFLTASEFSSERCSMDVAPEIWAKAAARALTGPFSFISN